MSCDFDRSEEEMTISPHGMLLCIDNPSGREDPLEILM